MSLSYDVFLLIFFQKIINFDIRWPDNFWKHHFRVEINNNFVIA